MIMLFLYSYCCMLVVSRYFYILFFLIFLRDLGVNRFLLLLYYGIFRLGGGF